MTTWTTFEVIYYFRCPICQNINVGSVDVTAPSEKHAAGRLVVACHYCCPLSATEVFGRTLVLPGGS